MSAATRAGRAVLTSHPAAQEAAAESLRLGASAIDAALTGFFAAAGATPWALFAPVTIVVAGSGSGVRLLDGRARQPGQGVERPVRYATLDQAPAFARVAASSTVAATSLAASMFGQKTLRQIVAPGVKLAKKHGAKQRAALLDRVGAARAWAMQDKDFLGEVAERVPRFEGALLQPSDLMIERVEVTPLEPTTKLAGAPAVVPPWHDPDHRAAGHLVVLVADRGSLAGLVVEQPPLGVALYDGEVELPALAAPPLKSVVRVKAGTSLAMSAPIAVVRDATSLLLVGTTGGQLDEGEIATLLSNAADLSAPGAAAPLVWPSHEPSLRSGLSMAVRSS